MRTPFYWKEIAQHAKELIGLCLRVMFLITEFLPKYIQKALNAMCRSEERQKDMCRGKTRLI